MVRFTAGDHRWWAVIALAGMLAGPDAKAQLPTTEERLQILTDPESVKAKLKKEKTKPPLEFFRSSIAPFDILPFMKENHWSTLSMEMRANYEDYAGVIQTSPVRMRGMARDGAVAIEVPQDVVYRRDARLAKEQRSRLSFQLLMPRVPKEINLELQRSDAIRADEVWQASLRTLEPHQMLVLVMSKSSTDAFARWNHFTALLPTMVERTDVTALDRQRYYRLVLPLDPEHIPLSAHPLTWSTLSHVVWDELAPEAIQPAQQQAMLDWLHWGGQLTLIGGAKPSFAALRESFLGPYLPADPSGENALLTQADLAPLSNAYRPPSPLAGVDDPRPVGDLDKRNDEEQRYLAPEPIRPASNRPVYLAGLRPRAGATAIPLKGSDSRLLGVEWRVGRGRVLMLAINPTDPAFVAWPGLDTMVRRLVLRRPEDPLISPGGWSGYEHHAAAYGSLTGPDLSWFRYISRDLGASNRQSPAVDVDGTNTGISDTAVVVSPVPVYGNRLGMPVQTEISVNPVAEWFDGSAVPRMTREALNDASGLSVPSRTFVLKVILAYIIALVPLNWLICRYVFGKREWAWIAVPVLALGFAIGVERAAAYDMGFDSACDEIDVVETYGGYPRAHLSRFASLYTTGRLRFTISYPDDPTALALPMDTGLSLRGEDVATSSWQSQPFPALIGLQVQPRSLALFRAEQMFDMSGAIGLDDAAGAPRIVNGSDVELRDAMLVEVGDRDHRRVRYLGTIGPGATVDAETRGELREIKARKGELNPTPFLHLFRDDFEDRAENAGEIRLVGWTEQVRGGQKLDPAVDRHRGFTVAVVHLRHGPPPSPNGPVYDALARPAKRTSLEQKPVAPTARRAPYGVAPPGAAAVLKRALQESAPP